MTRARNLAACIAGIVLCAIPAPRGAEKSEEKPAPALPVFAEGDWKGLHAVYSCAQFDAVVQPDGRLQIRPKDAKSAYVGRAFNFSSWGVNYHVPEKRRTFSRPVVEFTNPSSPTDRANRVTVEGVMKDDVKFKFIYTFKQNTVTVEGGITDPRTIEFPSRLHIGTSFPSSHDIPPQMEQEDREKLVKDHLLTVEYVDGKRSEKVEHKYADILQFRNAIKKVTMIGRWGPRTITIDPSPREVTIRGSNYTNNGPWQGYSFNYSTSETNMTRHRSKFILTVD